MGSGHILVYAFDLLMDIYRSRGYTDRDAVQSIVTNNLYGLDIDDRAAQLAYFAVMMKACEYDRRFLRRGIQPQVCAIQESSAIDGHALDSFGPDAALAKKLYAAFIDAKEYGSIIHVDLTGDELRRLSHSVIAMGAATTGESIANIGDSKHAAGIIAPLVKQAVIMARKYDVVVTNPPYMGASGMGEKLSKFVKDNYPDSKSDLFAVFIERCREIAKQNGYLAMITQHAWMFLSSFEKLRVKLLEIDTVNMAHLGARAFEGIGGEVVQTTTFVLQNSHIKGYKSTYCRLIDPTTQQGKEEMYLAGENRFATQQDNFKRVPGMPIAYWVSDAFLEIFSLPKLDQFAEPKPGMSTTNNDLFTRLWFEVEFDHCNLHAANRNDAQSSKKRWFPYNKGGEYRKWYGNNDYVVDWENDGYRLKEYTKGATGGRMVSLEYFFLECFTWSMISTKEKAFRYKGKGTILSNAAPATFTSDRNELLYLLGLMNTVIIQEVLRLISPTINCTSGNISVLPVKKEHVELVTSIVEDNIYLSTIDWDRNEVSWDFLHHPLI